MLDKGRGLFVVLNKSDVMQSTAAAKKQLVTYMNHYVPLVGMMADDDGVGGPRAFDRRLCALRTRYGCRVPAGADRVRSMANAHFYGSAEPVVGRGDVPPPAATHECGEGGEAEVSHPDEGASP